MEQHEYDTPQTEVHQLKGMSAPKSFTFVNNYGCWWAKSALPDDRRKALFKWAKEDDGFWKQDIIATVQFKKKSFDGTPIEAEVISVDIK